MQRFFLCLIITLFSSVIYSQNEGKLSSVNIPLQLLENANAVVRKNETQIQINSYDEFVVVTDRIVTILNKFGMRAMGAAQAYDDQVKVKDIAAVVYDNYGNKIEKFNQRDFKDVSAVPNGTLYSDNRMLYLEYTPRSFPITIHFQSEVRFKTTAFFPNWYPIENYNVSTEYSKYTIVNESDVSLMTKEYNIGNFEINKLDSHSYEANDLPALKPQVNSPDFLSLIPKVLVTLERFKMQGVDGYNNDWTTFGKWMNDNLLNKVGDLPKSVKIEIKSLVKDAISDREKAEIVYKFMQDRSRYISVQVGIGGWQPIEAMEVHEKAYGDCKGLSNYTKSLLAEVGIESNHAIIYGGKAIKNIDAGFSSTQGNHMILHIPQLDEDENVWLECTSKTSPFGYIAGFTDDRDALVVDSNGGRIIHTTKYDAEESSQGIMATIYLKSTGAATGDLELTTRGYQYGLRDHMVSINDKNAIRDYQNLWSNLNGLNIENYNIVNDQKSVQLIEKVQFNIEKLANKMGDILLINPVFFNKSSYEPPSYEERLYALKIDRGFEDIDEYNINLSDDLQVDALPHPIEIVSDFGIYKLSISSNDDGSLKVYRYLKINDGVFEKDRYKDYELFRSQIVTYDDSKAVLKIKK